MDSSSIAVLAAREQRRKGDPAPVAFSWQPPPRDVAPIPWEHAFIGAVSVQESIPVHYCEITADEMLQVLREDPARDPVTQAQFVEITVQKRAASLGVETILSGWGGDEGLSYYGRAYHADLFFRGRWIRAYQDARGRPGRPLGRVAVEVLSAVHPELPDVLSALLKGKRYRTGWNNFVHPDFAKRVRPVKPGVWRESSIRARLASAWASGVHADRMESWYCHGARRGITYAYPLLDRRILEFAAGLPPEQFVRQGWTRWLMRNTLEGILPRELCWHEDKDEPLLFPIMVRTVEHVMEKIGEALTAAPRLPPRSKYVDMTELLRRLRPEAIRNDPRAGGLLRTVKFLELEGAEVKL
jgi:asparagine synthase (glutamine-hydrolysing)